LKLKFKYPTSFFVYSVKTIKILKGNFKYKRLQIDFKVIGIDTTLNMPESKTLYIKNVSSIEFKVDNLTEKQTEESSFLELLATLESIINRVLLNVRNYGSVLNISLIRPDKDKVLHYLRFWEVKIFKNRNWNPLVQGDPFGSLFFASETSRTGNLSISTWPDIVEAVYDDIQSPPEKEFITNSKEHLERKNFRLALLEAIICLEIVLTPFLRGYLSIYSKLSNERINKFLNPNLGLTARISVLLNLCLSPEYIKRIKINEVLTVIKWRNEIIHKTGHLPAGISEEDLEKKINSVLSLSSLLAQRRDQIEATPELNDISRKINEKFQIPKPNIWIYSKHRVLVELTFFKIVDDMPKTDFLKAVSIELSKLLRIRDSRFKANDHLVIRYYSFPNDIAARWNKGKLNLQYEQLKVNST